MITLDDEHRPKQCMRLLEFSNYYFDKTHGDMEIGTRRNHRDSLRSLQRFAGDITLEMITYKLIQEYKLYNFGKLSPMTINHHLMHLRKTLRFAVRFCLIDHNPLEELDFVDQSKIPSRPTFTKPQLDGLLAMIQDLVKKSRGEHKCSYTEWLDIILLARSTGMRLQEVVNARWENVDWEDSTIAVLNSATFNTKTRVDRYIPLVPDTYAMLKRRFDKNELKCEYIFTIPNSEKRRNPLSVSLVFSDFLRMAGIPKGLSFKSLRSYFATTCVEQGVPVEQLHQWMGHSNIHTTMKYYVKMNKKNFAEQIKGVKF